MKELLDEKLRKLKRANSNSEIDDLLDEIVPLLKDSGISLSQVLMLFKTGDGGFGLKSQDHRSTITNSNKAQVILQKLMQKMKEK
ncbi:hypothetical protein EMN47_19215 [Prolixibacteraceae bacterium JC049]|nr:hypothetical protein [Prolixibacteraceae bacterium JC049]